MSVYTDPKLLDVAGAMEALPALPLGAGPQTEAAALSATGTDDLTPRQFAPEFVPATGKPRTLQSIRDKVASRSREARTTDADCRKCLRGQKKRPADNGCQRVFGMGGTGLEPATSTV